MVVDQCFRDPGGGAGDERIPGSVGHRLFGAKVAANTGQLLGEFSETAGCIEPVIGSPQFEDRLVGLGLE